MLEDCVWSPLPGLGATACRLAFEGGRGEVRSSVKSCLALHLLRAPPPLPSQYERYRVAPSTMDDVMGRLPWETLDALLDESFIAAQVRVLRACAGRVCVCSME